MRVHAIGVKRMSGKAKATGKPFDFTQLTILKAVEVSASETFQLQGYGYETCDLDVENESLPKFAGIKFPCQLDLVTSAVPGRRGIRTVITDIKQAA